MMNIEAMAREAGDDWDATLQHDKDFLARFHALARDAALEQAAAIVEGVLLTWVCPGADEQLVIDDCAAAIRAAKGAP